MDETTKPKSLDGRQAGGSHYKGLAVEPYQFAMLNGWDPASFSVLKRLSRYQKKDRRQDLEKALHEIDIRAELFQNGRYPYILAGPGNHKSNWMPMDQFLSRNGLNDHPSADALRFLERWVLDPVGSDAYLPALKGAIGKLVDDYDSGNYPPGHYGLAEPPKGAT